MSAAGARPANGAPSAEPAPARRGGSLRAALGWLAALALLAVLVRHVTWDELTGAWSRHASLPFVLFVVGMSVVPLPFDVWATRRAFAHLDLALPFEELLLVRGASYLPGLVSYALGQSGLGLYLVRRGVGLGRSAGALLFLATTQAISLLALAGLAAALGGVPAIVGAPIGWALAVGATGCATYLALLAAGPVRLRWLARLALAAPLFAAGPRGHLRAAAERMPHLVVLTLLGWGAMRVWGIAVPASVALALLPFVMMVATLPATPGGLGTVQAAQVFLFAPFAPGASTAAQRADVLACGLTGHVLGLVVQGAVGLVCLALLARRARAGSARVAP